uniref:Uncharacterized protein n=1 Tax=virus sp. ctIVh9 TaxID=2826797 RepID=A0A8S5R8Y8_9VIRU|nr:MAG TPA: hypothetical protein [virus sp. ctIVh9]
MQLNLFSFFLTLVHNVLKTNKMPFVSDIILP